jgi:plasmid stabilization system protein ParE
MTYTVLFLPEATADLRGIYDHIAPQSGDAVARDFVGRLYGYCLGLDTFPERGTVRNDIRPSLRILGYRRQATIAFTVHEEAVAILRILGRGQDVERELLK